MKRKLTTLFLVTFLLSLALCSTAFAAQNACVNVSGSASSYNSWKTITIKTGKNWGSNKITFTQTQGEMTYSPQPNATKLYGAYTIKVTDQSTNKTTEYYWKYTKDYTKIKLEDNKSYTIKIKPYNPKTIAEQKLSSRKTLEGVLGSMTRQNLYDTSKWYWRSAPTWSVKSTKAVDWCYASF